MNRDYSNKEYDDTLDKWGEKRGEGWNHCRY